MDLPHLHPNQPVRFTEINEIPLNKGGKGRRPWGLSWQIREPEGRELLRGFCETVVPPLLREAVKKLQIDYFWRLVLHFINTVTYYVLLNPGLLWHIDSPWRLSICHGKVLIQYC